MKLEFLICVNEEEDNVMRLYDFNDSELNSLKFLIKENLVDNSNSLSLHSLSFILPLNCKLELKLCENNIGIQVGEDNNFQCNLTKEGYERMIQLINTLIGKEDCYQWLYDNYSQTEFLLSKSGLW